jgi:dTDP-4-amino-4,6-dideoxygalactose transaminase
MRLLRSWGERRRYEHSIKGFNYRMDALQGAVLGVKLKHLEGWIEARRSHARRYNGLLAASDLRLPRERSGVRHVYYAYSVRLQQRDAWRAHLTDNQIQTAVHYPVPVHLQRAYRDLGYSAGDFPIAEQVAQEILSIPIFPEMAADQIETVADVLRAGLPAGTASPA